MYVQIYVCNICVQYMCGAHTKPCKNMTSNALNSSMKTRSKLLNSTQQKLEKKKVSAYLLMEVRWRSRSVVCWGMMASKVNCFCCITVCAWPSWWLHQHSLSISSTNLVYHWVTKTMAHPSLSCCRKYVRRQGVWTLSMACAMPRSTTEAPPSAMPYGCHGLGERTSPLTRFCYQALLQVFPKPSSQNITGLRGSLASCVAGWIGIPCVGLKEWFSKNTGWSAPVYLLSVDLLSKSSGIPVSCSLLINCYPAAQGKNFDWRMMSGIIELICRN